jgi:pSer/pThr/pTyr-binding forkhead associated (FHA) protein
MKVHLVVVKGVPAGREIPIAAMPRLLIGRSDQCHLCPTSDLVSRRHCEIVQHEGGVFVHDLESANGTYVNDLQVGGVAEVHDGDRLGVGPLVFQFKITQPGQGPSRYEAEDCPSHLRSGRSGAG